MSAPLVQHVFVRLLTVSVLAVTKPAPALDPLYVTALQSLCPEYTPIELGWPGAPAHCEEVKIILFYQCRA